MQVVSNCFHMNNAFIIGVPIQVKIQLSSVKSQFHKKNVCLHRLFDFVNRFNLINSWWGNPQLLYPYSFGLIFLLFSWQVLVIIEGVDILHLNLLVIQFVWKCLFVSSWTQCKSSCFIYPLFLIVLMGEGFKFSKSWNGLEFHIHGENMCKSWAFWIIEILCFHKHQNYLHMKILLSFHQMVWMLDNWGGRCPTTFCHWKSPILSIIKGHKILEDVWPCGPLGFCSSDEASCQHSTNLSHHF